MVIFGTIFTNGLQVSNSSHIKHEVDWTDITPLAVHFKIPLSIIPNL